MYDDWNANIMNEKPTENFGDQCNKLNSVHFMNKCSYHGAYEMLQFLYGGLIKPSGMHDHSIRPTIT